MERRATVVAVFALATALVLSGCSLPGRIGTSKLTDVGEGRLVLDDAGIAVTFPHDWLLESPPSVASRGLAAVLPPGQRDLLVPLVAAMPPTRHDRCVVADIAPLVGARPEWRTLDDVVTGVQRLFAQRPRWVGLDSAIVELPSGQAGRVSRVIKGEAASFTTYFFTEAEAWFMLECFAQTVRPRDWRSLAESFEFLPEPADVEPIGFNGMPDGPLAPPQLPQ